MKKDVVIKKESITIKSPIWRNTDTQSTAYGNCGRELQIYFPFFHTVQLTFSKRKLTTSRAREETRSDENDQTILWPRSLTRQRVLTVSDVRQQVQILFCQFTKKELRKTVHGCLYIKFESCVRLATA